MNLACVICRLRGGVQRELAAHLLPVYAAGSALSPDERAGRLAAINQRLLLQGPSRGKPVGVLGLHKTVPGHTRPPERDARLLARGGGGSWYGRGAKHFWSDFHVSSASEVCGVSDSSRFFGVTRVSSASGILL